METRKNKVSKMDRLVPVMIACAIIASCAFFLPKNEKLYIEKNEADPYIALIPQDTNGAGDVSVGFFVPLDYNIAYKAAVPKLFYDVFLVDISSINVFKKDEKMEIAERIDSLKNVFASNILDAVYLSEYKNIAEIEYSNPGNVEIYDVVSGEKHISTGEWKGDQKTVVVHKDGEIFFYSPSDVECVFQKNLIEYKNLDTKLFKINRVM